MNRLPDFELEVLVEAAAEGAWNAKAAHAGGPQFPELERGRRNEVREAALPFIFHGTKALADLGYVKHRLMSTVEELDALPIGSVLLSKWNDAWQVSKNDEEVRWYVTHEACYFTSNIFLDQQGPFTLVHEAAK